MGLVGDGYPLRADSALCMQVALRVVELRCVVMYKLLTLLGLQEDLVYKKVGGTSRGGDADYIQAMISN